MTEVGIGTAIVAYIEPHAGQALEFNRWYERDHFYAATTAGPGAFSGARWVATRACKAVRPPGATWFGDAARGSFLTTVWLLDGKQAEWDAWVAKEMEELRAQPGRMFPGRDHVHTAVYRYFGEGSTDDTVSAAVALDRGYAGVVAIAVPDDEDAKELVGEILGPDIPVSVGLAQERVILSQAEPPPHAIVLGFTPGDPLDAWRSRVEPALARFPSVGFASPFLRTIPGTDAYVDDI